MKIGTQTGSLVNHVLSGSKQEAPYVGMPATICGWSDRYPATVVMVQGPFIALRGCDYKAVPGHCNAFTEDQRYTYEENPDGGISWFRLMDDGKWVQHNLNTETGRFVKAKSGSGMFLGRREKYRDPCF